MAVKKATWSQKSTGDILHPETEVDQLKSFGTSALASIISTLLKAATTADARAAIEAAAASHAHTTGDIQSFASQVVSAIGSETLSALGVRYSITTNGYICFGDLFGGLILQWTCFVPYTVINGVKVMNFPLRWPHAPICGSIHGGSVSFNQVHIDCDVVLDNTNNPVVDSIDPGYQIAFRASLFQIYDDMVLRYVGDANGAGNLIYWIGY